MVLLCSSNKMDTFGRLPTDVIDKIEKIYQLPIISIENNGNNFYIFINTNNIIYKIKSRLDIDQKPKMLSNLHTFISNLRNNIATVYNGDINYYIKFENYISIETEDGSELILDNSYKDIFADALQKYHDILDNGYLVTRADVIGNYVGSTVHKTKVFLEQHKGKIVLIDDALFTFDDFGIDAINTMNVYMNENKNEKIFYI